MSLDVYFERRYERQEYNCLAFAADIWKDQTGQDIREALDSLLGRTEGRKVMRQHVAPFQKHPSPVDPCLVVMQRPRCTPHIGIYIRGKVIHILERGVEYQPLDVASQSFSSVRFYTCRP